MKPETKELLEKSIREVPDFPKNGIVFKDITPVLLKPELIRAIVEDFAEQFKDKGITKVVGIESRGFLFGPMLAEALGCGFVIVRKKGKLPAEIIEVSYDLEYGSATIEMHKDAIKAEDVVLIHDDLLATGGTAAAAAQLAQVCGAHIGGFCFLIELEFLNGMQRLNPLSKNVYSTLNYK